MWSYLLVCQLIISTFFLYHAQYPPIALQQHTSILVPFLLDTVPPLPSFSYRTHVRELFLPRSFSIIPSGQQLCRAHALHQCFHSLGAQGTAHLLKKLMSLGSGQILPNLPSDKVSLTRLLFFRITARSRGFRAHYSGQALIEFSRKRWGFPGVLQAVRVFFWVYIRAKRSWSIYYLTKFFGFLDFPVTYSRGPRLDQFVNISF